MKFLNFLTLGLLLLTQTHCSHSGQVLVRQLSHLEKGNCPPALSKLSTSSGTALAVDKGEPRTSAILPPAETQTLKPLNPGEFASFSKRPSIRISTYNVLNLKEMVGRYEPDLTTGKRTKTQAEKPKSQEAIDGVSNAIKEINPDIIFLQEIEGTDSLGAFAEKELGKKWRPLIIKGNDSRGIHIGALVKNTMPLFFEYHSHQNEPFSNPHHPELSRVFSRDFPVLIAKSPNDGSILFLMAGVHGKSKRSENNQDPESREIRTAQAEKMIEIIQDYQTQYPNVPFMILGDFNAEVSSEPEYQTLRDFNLKDVFELMPNPIPSGDPKRITHTYHPKDSSRKTAQLDSILVAPPFHNIVQKAQVFRYKNPDGTVKPIPNTYEERQRNPSDHFPIWAELDLQTILKRN